MCVDMLPIKFIEDAESLASRAIGKVAIPEWRAMVNDIATALHSRDERAAGIAEAMRPSGGRMWTDEQHACFDALSTCAANIRDQKINGSETR